MYDCIRAAGLEVGAIYFVVTVVLGTMIVLELFVAILLVGFEDDPDKPEKPGVMRLLSEDSKGRLTERRFT